MCVNILHEIILEADCTVDHIIIELPLRLQKKWDLEVRVYGHGKGCISLYDYCSARKLFWLRVLLFRVAHTLIGSSFLFSSTSTI